MRVLTLLSAVILFMTLNGCLIFNRISYEIKTDGKAGTAEITVYDLRSNAAAPSEFEEDKENLFEYMWKSDKFIEDMKKEDKHIISRDLYLKGDTLNGRVVFKFNNISGIENIVAEDGFYYLTLPLADEILSTNGEVIESKDYKRILWDDSFEVLKFEILSFSFDEERYRPLGFHFKSLK
jgi:hypothetical protein